jgi:quinohemoprotein ethanol dehydrogenase
MNDTRIAVALAATFTCCAMPFSLRAEAGGAASPAQFGAIDDGRLANAPAEPQNWMAHGGPYPEWYYSPLDHVNVDNVQRLAPAWSFDFDTIRGQEATPIVVDGVLYTTTAWNKTYALDAKSGRQLWFYDPKVPGELGYKACCDVINRGPAVYRGKVFISTVDGRLIALDARTGKLVWSVNTVGRQKMYSISGAPRVMRGKVIIGNSGGEFGVRGYVSAYDVRTGKLAWRFYTVPDAPAKGPDGAASDEALKRIASPGWSGNWYKYGGGGAPWNSIVCDPELNRVYVGTSNPYPWNQKYRSDGKGDNLFTDSIIALDADTGRYVWHYQETPGDSWDYDATEDMVLAEITVAGRTRKVLMQAPKNGFFYVLDRKNGKLISADPFVAGITWATGVDAVTGRPNVDPNARYANGPFEARPSAEGAHNWYPSAYSPKTRLVYIPAAENSLVYAGVDHFENIEGIDNLGIQMGPPPQSKGGAPASAASTPKGPPASQFYLLAWDPVARKAAWHVPVRGGGVLATGGGLVFQGRHRNGTAGELDAYRADSGQKLWSYQTPNAILTGAISYSVDGEQYIAVVAGAGGGPDLVASTGAVLAQQPGRVYAFKLDGKATLAPDPPPAPAANPPSQTGSNEDVNRGQISYGKYCARCHGFGINSSNIVPDLRRSAALTDQDLWKNIVIGGVLKNAGMIGWSRFLSPQDAEAIRSFVASEARRLADEPQQAPLP